MPLKHLVPISLVAALLLLTGCSAAAGGDGTRRDSSVITSEELANSGTSNLHDAVNRLRPRWMTARAARTLDMQEGGIFVYQNNTRLGNTDVLRQMNIANAFALRYLDAASAQATLPGLRNQSVEGAIVIFPTEEDFLQW